MHRRRENFLDHCKFPKYRTVAFVDPREKNFSTHVKAHSARNKNVSGQTAPLIIHSWIERISGRRKTAVMKKVEVAHPLTTWRGNEFSNSRSPKSTADRGRRMGKFRAQLLTYYPTTFVAVQTPHVIIIQRISIPAVPTINFGKFNWQFTCSGSLPPSAINHRIFWPLGSSRGTAAVCQ